MQDLKWQAASDGWEKIMSEVVGARLLASADDRGWRVVDHRNGSVEILLGPVGTIMPLAELPAVASLVGQAVSLPKERWIELKAATSRGIFCCNCCDTRAVVLGQTILRFTDLGLRPFTAYAMTQLARSGNTDR